LSIAAAAAAIADQAYYKDKWELLKLERERLTVSLRDHGLDGVAEPGEFRA
jgi:histidinol-phosphate/aromatic aminotransferase/cobyric acid decarboxylase-like protein